MHGSAQRLIGPSGLALVLAVLCLLVADSQPARADEPPPPPASLKEAEQVIDLRAFPTLERAERFHQTRSKVGYTIARPDFDSDVQFYHSKLMEAEWKIDRQDLSPEKRYGLLYCSKEGFGLGVSIVKDPNTGKMNAFVENYGNIDARTLPRFAGASERPSQFNSANYETDGAVDAVAEFLRAEMKKLGWREVLGYGGQPDSEAGEHHRMQFVQRGIAAGVSVEKAEGKTRVMAHVSVMRFAPPIMPEVSGGIEFIEEPFLKVLYATKATPAEVLAFYRKELPAQGWTILAAGAPDAEGKLELPLTGPDKEPLRLELLAKDGLTLVQLAGAGS